MGKTMYEEQLFKVKLPLWVVDGPNSHSLLMSEKNETLQN
jgi:hypothetical protein